MASEREKALAEALDIDVEEIESAGKKYAPNLYEVGRAEYMVLTDDEADREVKAYIKDSLFAFNTDFIVPFVREDVAEELENEGGSVEEYVNMLKDKYEDANADLEDLIDDMDRFVHDAVASDGRGHFLAPYDHNELEAKVNGKWYFIYRVN
jgi:hypothetical protein